MVQYCLHLGLRTSALTLREEAADALPGVQLPATTSANLGGGGGGGGSHSAAAAGGGAADGLALWRWLKLARQHAALAQGEWGPLSPASDAVLQPGSTADTPATQAFVHRSRLPLLGP